jgi:hypothetical protein
MNDKERLIWLEAEAEKAYGDMYDAPLGASATAAYSNAKEFLNDAIALAQRLGRREDVERLEIRLVHIKSVFRSHFS